MASSSHTPKTSEANGLLYGGREAVMHFGAVIVVFVASLSLSLNVDSHFERHRLDY